MIGLGHLRRTLAITEELAQADAEATSLIVTGAPVQPLFELPPRVETVTLPTLTRDGNGNRRSRRLALDDEEVGRLRGEIARAVATGFRPDCAVVDRFPLGLDGELGPALDALKAAGTKLVLGLRDIEDDRAGVRRAWNRSLRDAIEAYYDLVLVYGPAKPRLDAIDCLGWHDLALKVPFAHVGYVGTAVPTSGPSDVPAGYVLGRPCEFGPSRSVPRQRRDLDAGRQRLRELLGDAVEPIFTPPWNRCTETTGRCLLELGFRALARDSTAKPLGLPGLAEIDIRVDWSARTKGGGRIGLRELGERLATAASMPGPTGVMLHHALVDRRERGPVETLLTLVGSHANARCRAMASFCAEAPAASPAPRPR